MWFEAGRVVVMTTKSVSKSARTRRFRRGMPVVNVKKGNQVVSEDADGFVVDPLLVKVKAMAQALGSNSAAAEYLGVSRGQPGKWMAGSEGVSRAVARKVHDFDWVWQRLVGEMRPDDAVIWLTSANAFLDGTEPIVWLQKGRPERVIQAIDGEVAGAYA